MTATAARPAAKEGRARRRPGAWTLSLLALVLLLASGGTDRRRPPLVGKADPALMADPLPQAFVLTAIVITFGTTVYLLSMIHIRRPGGRAEGPPG